jgi:polyhydroxyalkanoate synthesis regulator phasin
MERFAFSLSAESKDWIEDQADKLNISQAVVMRRCIAQARRSGLDDTSSDTLSDTDQGSDTVGDTDYESLQKRVNALESRVDAMESPDDGNGSARTDAADNASDLRDRVTSQIGDGRSPNAKNAIIDTVALLRDDGPVGTGDIKGMLDSDHTDHYGSGESAWKSINSHVEQIDGVHQPGYGEWDYQPPE